MFLRYGFLADNVSIDANGKVTAIGIFDVIFSAKFPTLHRDMTVVAQLEGTYNEKGEHKVSVELRDNKDNKIVSYEQKVNVVPGVSPSSIRTGFVTKVQDLPFQKPGQYEYVMFIDGRFLGRIPFIVQQLHVAKAGNG